MSDHLAVFGEVELSFDEAIRELAGLDSERADVSGNHLIVFSETAPEDNFEDTCAAPVRRTEDQSNEVRIDGEWRHGWGYL